MVDEDAADVMAFHERLQAAPEKVGNRFLVGNSTGEVSKQRVKDYQVNLAAGYNPTQSVPDVTAENVRPKVEHIGFHKLPLCLREVGALKNTANHRHDILL